MEGRVFPSRRAKGQPTMGTHVSEHADGKAAFRPDVSSGSTIPQRRAAPKPEASAAAMVAPTPDIAPVSRSCARKNKQHAGDR